MKKLEELKGKHYMQPLKDYLVKAVTTLSLVGMLSGCYQDVANYYQRKLKDECEEKWQPNGLDGPSDPELLSYLCCKSQSSDDKDSQALNPFPGLVGDYYEDLELICEDGEAKELTIKYDDGGKLIQRMENGKIHGLQESWYDSGELQTKEIYVNGKRVGEAKEWHKNGQLNKIEVWENNDLKQVTTFWENGQRQHLKEMKDGLRHGKMKNWSPDGTLFRDEVYEKGKELTISSD
jgi:antitoxin component YwqK of YwqJK toxin-antitoxin module